jgi:hypothetical protein
MRKVIACVVMCVLCAASGCMSVSQRRTFRKVMAVYDEAALTCDVSQTIAFSDGGKWDLGQHGQPVEEANPIYGHTPTPTALLTGLMATIGTVVLAQGAQNRLGDAWLAGVGIVETVVVANNYQFSGLCGADTSRLQKVR